MRTLYVVSHVDAHAGKSQFQNKLTNQVTAAQLLRKDKTVNWLSRVSCFRLQSPLISWSSRLQNDIEKIWYYSYCLDFWRNANDGFSQGKIRHLNWALSGKFVESDRLENDEPEEKKLVTSVIRPMEVFRFHSYRTKIQGLVIYRRIWAKFDLGPIWPQSPLTI